MRLSGADILARVDELSNSLKQTLEKLDRMGGELGEIRASVEGRASELEQVLGQDGAGQLASLAGGGGVLREVSDVIEKLSAGNSQEEILEILLQETQGHLERAILFRESNGRFTHWKSRGFDDQLAESLSAEEAEDPIVRAARKQCIIYREESPEEVFSWLEKAGPIPQVSICIPLVFGQQVPVVLYGDASQPASLDSLELMSHLAVLVLKNQYLRSQLESGEAQPSAGFSAGAALQEPPAAEQAKTETDVAVFDPESGEAPAAESGQAAAAEGEAEEGTDEMPFQASEEQSQEIPGFPPGPSLEKDVISGEVSEEDFISKLSAQEAASQVQFEEAVEYEVAPEPPHEAPQDEQSEAAEYEVAPEPPHEAPQDEQSEAVEYEVAPEPPDEAPQDEQSEAEEFEVAPEPPDEAAQDEQSEAEEFEVAPEPPYEAPKDEQSGAAPPVPETPVDEDPVETPAEDLESASGLEPAPETGTAEVEDQPEPMLLPSEPQAAPLPDPEAERHHKEARRFARLLVTEIKLYNEEALEAGRQNQDIYERLQRDINRSREMYEKRAHASVKSHTDHFHVELERILAGGEPDLLGESYPGPRTA